MNTQQNKVEIAWHSTKQQEWQKEHERIKHCLDNNILVSNYPPPPLTQPKESVNSTNSDLEKNRMRGPGGAPTRATTLPTEAAARKNFPIASGFLDYFPDAIVAISAISKAGNDQHNPGLPLRWDRSKSQDEADTCFRHFLQRGTLDMDGKRHTAKAAWRLLALLQKEIEQEQDNEKV
jgi:hypothetical protein